MKHEASWTTPLNKATAGNVILSSADAFYLAASENGTAILGQATDKFVIAGGVIITLAEAQPKLFTKLDASEALKLTAENCRPRCDVPMALPLEPDDIGQLVAGALRRGLDPAEAVERFIADADLHGQLVEWAGA